MFHSKRCGTPFSTRKLGPVSVNVFGPVFHETDEGVMGLGPRHEENHCSEGTGLKKENLKGWFLNIIDPPSIHSYGFFFFLDSFVGELEHLHEPPPPGSLESEPECVCCRGQGAN